MLSLRTRLPEERAVYISEFCKPEVCARCSQESHKTVFFEYGHKTVGTAVVVGLTLSNNDLLVTVT